MKEHKLKPRASREQRLHDQRPASRMARRNKHCWPEAQDVPRQSRHCESVLLEQMSPLSCYEVKASACSESHSQADINVWILYPVIDL